MKKTHSTKILQRVIELAERCGESRIHLGLLVGEETPTPWLPVSSLSEVVRPTGELSLTFEWGGGMVIRVMNSDGSWSRELELKF